MILRFTMCPSKEGVEVDINDLAIDSDCVQAVLETEHKSRKVAIVVTLARSYTVIDEDRQAIPRWLKAANQWEDGTCRTP